MPESVTKQGQVWALAEIQRALAGVDVLAAMERAFVAYSEGRAIVPPVGELLFDSPPGDAHIKYGYIRGDSTFVIKVATGFYENDKNGLPPNSGVLMVFSSRTGLLEAVLLDEGHLTNVRTAAAGMVAAKHLAPRNVTAIGVCGTGVQARMQVQYLQTVTGCREVVVWGRSASAVERYISDMSGQGFSVTGASTPAEVAARCNLIVTATPSSTPLLRAQDIRPGTHITAMGSDTPGKNELFADVLGSADLIAVDSLVQCEERGELHHAIKEIPRVRDRAVELGKIIAGHARGRGRESDITVCDLTGVAVQDIEISKAVLTRLQAP